MTMVTIPLTDFSDACVSMTKTFPAYIYSDQRNTEMRFVFYKKCTVSF